LRLWSFKNREWNLLNLLVSVPVYWFSENKITVPGWFRFKKKKIKVPIQDNLGTEKYNDFKYLSPE